MGVKSEFYHICGFQYAYVPLTFNLDLVSKQHDCAGFLSADAGKTTDRVVTSHLLRTVI